MSKTGIFALCAVIMLPLAADAANSYLTAQSFPKTFDDLSFTDRMAVLAAGYEDFDPVYENGVCVSGCAYRGIKLEDELKQIERDTAAANARLVEYRLMHPEENINATPQTGQNATNPTINPTPNIPTVGDTNSGTSGSGGTVPAPQLTHTHTNTTTPPTTTTPARACAQYSNTIKPGLNTVAQAPLDGELVIASDFGSRTSPCKTCSSNHRGIDLRATTGTNVYAPANGTVIAVKTSDGGCGKQIQIQHPDGIITQYCHLSQQLVRVGDTVQGGCLIAKTGNTGSSTGPHLHYALMTAPQRFLDPLWQENRLGRAYSFKPGTPQSPEHSGNRLPGKTN